MLYSSSVVPFPVIAPSRPIFTRSHLFILEDVVEAELEELAQASTKRLDFDGKGVNGGSGAYWRSAKNNIENLINFGPIYRCLHIHSVSGERSEFEHYYFTQRRKQCQLILSLSPSQQVRFLYCPQSVNLPSISSSLNNPTSSPQQPVNARNLTANRCIVCSVSTVLFFRKIR